MDGDLRLWDGGTGETDLTEPGHGGQSIEPLG